MSIYNATMDAIGARQPEDGYHILITDVGTISEAIIHRDRPEITSVPRSGGCPVESIITTEALEGETDDEIAYMVLHDWMERYDGNPAENRLSVEIIRDGVSTARKSA